MRQIPWEVMLIMLPLTGAMACFFWPRRAITLGLITALGVVVGVAGLGWRVL